MKIRQSHIAWLLFLTTRRGLRHGSDDLENRATLSMQHYAAVTTAICNILSSRLSATMELMFIPLHHNVEGQLDELRKPRRVRLPLS
jgi:hypothetical protein